jgi:hypothetical protein
MAETYVVGDADRLPWLTDEVKRRKKSGGWVVSFLASSVVAIIAALSFWLGMNGGLRPRLGVEAQPEVQVELPPAASSNAPVLLQPEPAMPQVEPSPVPPSVVLPAQEEVRLEAPPVRRVAAKRAAAAHRARASAAKPIDKPVEDSESTRYANPWKSTGVSGRMVRVGAYSSLEKSKEAWSRLAELSPAIKQLPAVVTDIQTPNGSTLYWLQIGTTSQAHSEVLCQRMRAIRQSCVVVDVAGARKGSKNERQPVGI